MNIKIQFMLDNDPLLKRYLKEHSYYYKNIIRNPEYIYKIIELMKKEYHLTSIDKLDTIKNNLSMFNTFVDVLK